MSASEIVQLLGKAGRITIAAGVSIDVTIRDVKQAYGRIRYVVEPVAGSGQLTVETVVLA